MQNCRSFDIVKELGNAYLLFKEEDENVSKKVYYGY